MNKARLQAGQSYLNCRGDFRGPMDERTPDHFLDQYGTGYYPDGRQWDHVPGSTGNIDLSTAGVSPPADALVAELVEAVERCRTQFDFYVSAHMSKQPPDMDKAATNQEFVELCEAALTRAKAAMSDGAGKGEL